MSGTSTPPPSGEEQGQQEQQQQKQQPINKIIPLDLREELDASSIVDEFIIDYRTDTIRFSLNGKYNGHTVVSDFDINK